MSHLKNVGKSKSLDSSDIFHSSCQSPSFIAKEKKILEQIEPVEKVSTKNARLESGEDKTINKNKSSKRSKSSNSSNRMTAREFFSSPLMRRKKDSGASTGRGLLS